MRKDVREFIRRLDAAGLTVEPTPGDYRLLREGKSLRKANGMPFTLPFSPDTIRGVERRSSSSASSASIRSTSQKMSTCSLGEHAERLPFSTKYDASSAALPLSTCSRRGLPSAGTKKTSPAETICNSLAEGEHVSLDARLEEGDLEGAVRDRSRLPDQLIQPLVHHRAVALFVNVEPVRVPGRPSVDEHAERNGGPWRPWTQDQVDVARVEAERDPPAGFVQHARASLDRPVGLYLEPLESRGDQVIADAAAPSFAQQPLDHPFALVVSALAELVVLDSPFRIGDVHGRPVVVAEGSPHRVIGVERDRVLDAHLLRSAADVLGILLERELRGVDADHDQPLILVLLGPRADVAERAEPVDARVRPEVDENDFSAQARRREWLRVEPARRPVEGGQVPLDRTADIAEQAHAVTTRPASSRTAFIGLTGMRPGLRSRTAPAPPRRRSARPGRPR